MEDAGHINNVDVSWNGIYSRLVRRVYVSKQLKFH